MGDEGWHEGTLYDDEGEFALAHISYRLHRSVEIDGFPQVTGSFTLREELSPLHTGMAQLVAPGGEPCLVRVTRISRPQGHGDLEVVEPLQQAP